MDRFKFRGFYAGGMYEVFSFCNDFVKLVIDGEIQKVLRSEVVLMQATGLKDKNGKLIFEGDVVREEYENLEGNIEYDNHLVVFEHGAFQLALNGNKNNLEIMCCFKGEENQNLELEIIGNRFETPELLNNL